MGGTPRKKKSPDEEEGVDGNDPDGIEGITEEFIVYLTRAVMKAQQGEQHC